MSKQGIKIPRCPISKERLKEVITGKVLTAEEAVVYDDWRNTLCRIRSESGKESWRKRNPKELE